MDPLRSAEFFTGGDDFEIGSEQAILSSFGRESGTYNGIYYWNWMEHARLFMHVGVSGKWIPVDEVYYVGQYDGPPTLLVIPSPTEFFEWIDQRWQVWQISFTMQDNYMLFAFCLKSCSWLCHLVESFDVCIRTYSSLLDSRFHFEPAHPSRCSELNVESLANRILSAQACKMYLST